MIEALPAAIDEIDDPEQVRFVLYASNRPVSTPISALSTIIPDYDTTTGMASIRVPSWINAFRTKGYATAGDGGGALFKRVAVEPTHAGKVQTLDGAWWEIAESVIIPQMLGLIDDSGVLDQTVVFQAWVDTCTALGKPCIAPVPAWIKITDTITFPNADLNIKQLRITYTGTRDRKVLYFPSVNNKELTFGIVEGNTAVWTNDDYRGIYLHNMVDCYIRLQLTRRFTVGLTMAATGTCAYNKVWEGDLSDNKYHLRIEGLAASGFVNENNFFGGNYIESSAVNALGTAVGVHIKGNVGMYNGHNNNRWYGPSFQLAGEVAAVNRTPFFCDGAGGANFVRDARVESSYGPNAIYSANGANVTENEFGMSFGDTSTSGQLNTIQERNGASGNRLTGRYAPEVRASWNNLHRLLSSNGTANGGYVRGDVFLVESSSGAAKRATTAADRIRSNALALDLNSTACMVAVDTSKIKQWRLNIGLIDGLNGNVIAIAFDAAGNRLTGNSLDILGTAWAASTAYSTVGQVVTNDTGKIYQLATAGTSAGAGGPTGTGSAIVDGTCVWNFVGRERYIKNTSATYVESTSYGGCYLGPASRGGLFSVRPEVATMWIGVYSSAIRSMELVGYSTSETLDNTSGLTSVVPFVPLDDSGSVLLASANPATAGTHGYYSVGQIVYNSGAASGQPEGWQCTTAGWLAAAWAISTAYGVPGRIVTNDSGKMYQLVTAGTSAGAGGPTGTGSGITDGTCVWDYVGVKAAFTVLQLVSTPQTVASLPAAATAGSGARLFVSDATAPAWGAAVAGGGAVPCPVFSDGTNWNVG